MRGRGSNQVWTGGFDAASNTGPFTRPYVGGVTVMQSGVFNTRGGSASSTGGSLQGTPSGYTVVAPGGSAAPGVPGKTFQQLNILATGGQNRTSLTAAATRRVAAGCSSAAVPR